MHTPDTFVISTQGLTKTYKGVSAWQEMSVNYTDYSVKHGQEDCFRVMLWRATHA